MQSDFESNDVSVESSSTTETGGSASQPSFAGKVTADRFSQVLAERDGNPEDDEGNSPAKEESESSASPDSQSEQAKADPQKEKVPNGVQKRINRLVAENKATKSEFQRVVGESRQKDIELARKDEIIKLFEEDYRRLSGKAQLDPREEQLISEKTKFHMERFDSGIEEQVGKKYSEQQAQMERKAKIEEIKDSMREAATEYSDLFSAGQLASYMKRNKLRDPVQAAKKYSGEIVRASQKRLSQTPEAPRSMTSQGTTGVNRPNQFKYSGARTIEAMLEEQERARRGR